MEGTTPWRPRVIVGGALAIGFAVGCFFMAVNETKPAFLDGVTPLAEKDEKASSGGGKVSYYTLDVDWKQVVARAKKELPSAIEHDTLVGGLQAKVLTIPRVENGRMQLFYPPDEEITFMPRRLALNDEGRVLVLAEANHPWTGIQLREFRKPRSLDGLVDWFKKSLKV